ncbi:MAG: PAS domain-containing protein [Pseudomonadota bacterium]|nr:PAS domain-containing protein [Pseudomonadota bacterium]
MPHAMSHQQLIKLVAGAAAAVFETNASGHITRLSGWEEMTGQTSHAAQGSGWLDVLHPDDVQRAGEAWKNALDHGIEYNTEFRVKMQDGSYRWYNARGVPEFDGEGNVSAWIGMILRMAHRMRPNAIAPVSRDDASATVVAIRPAALRAARAMLGWSAEDLAREAGLSRSTVRRMETDDAKKSTQRSTMQRLIRTLSNARLELLSEDGTVNGVRWLPYEEQSSTVLPFPDRANRA